MTVDELIETLTVLKTHKMIDGDAKVKFLAPRYVQIVNAFYVSTDGNEIMLTSGRKE